MKIRCKKCRDIIEGDKKGKFIQCSCKSCYIDETEHYCRLGGEFNDIEAVIDFTEYNDMLTDKQELTKYKERCEKAIDYVRSNLKCMPNPDGIYEPFLDCYECRNLLEILEDKEN